MSFSDRNQKSNKSTAPLTGRDISAQNALKHGCCATNTVLLPTDNPDDYKSLQHTWCQAYNPKSDAERKLIEELVQADWFQIRSTRNYAMVETKLLTEQPDPTQWSETQKKDLGRFLRYRTANANAFIRAKKSLEDFRKARLAEKANAAKQTMADERHKLRKQKATKPAEPTWLEHLENMKQQAINLGFAKPEDFIDPDSE